MAENLKINIGADTKDFEKGARKVKSELKDLSKVSDRALSDLGSAFGVNTGQIQQMGSALRGLGERLSQQGNAGAAAFGNMLKGLNAFKVGIAGLGLAAVTTAFKALHSEAEAFRKTVQGADLDRSLTAFVDTYRQALSDMREETGRTIAEAETRWQKFWRTFGATVKEVFLSGEAAQAALGIEVNPSGGNTGRATTVANRAEAIATEIYNLERKRSDTTRRVAELDAQIAEQRRIAADHTYTAQQRMAAIQSAQAAILEKRNLQLPIEQRISALMDEMNSLTSSTPAQIDAANQQYVRTQGIIRQADEELKSLARTQKAVTAEVEKERRAREEARAIMAEELPRLPGITGTATTGAAVGIKLEPYYDPKEIVDISQDIAATLERGISSFAESIGTLLGELASGSDKAWSNFGDAMLSTLGDLAMTVGSIAVSIGVALLAIKAGLESLQPVPMMIAGAALIVLGAAAKASIKQAASGSYSANTSSLGTASYSEGTNVAPEYNTSVMEIRVTGELTASGNQLKAVIQNEDRRLRHTT